MADAQLLDPSVERYGSDDANERGASSMLAEELPQLWASERSQLFDEIEARMRKTRSRAVERLYACYVQRAEKPVVLCPRRRNAA